MNGRPRVVVFDPIPGDWTFEPERAALARHGVDLSVPDSPGEADDLIRDADVVIVTGVRRLEAEAIAALTRAAGILCYSIGMDKVDRAAATQRDIPVRNIPDYCTDEVSDHALALLLAAERRLVPITRAMPSTWWLKDRVELKPIRRIRGQTLGVLGAGRIGRSVARKARGLGFSTIAHDPLVAVTADPDLELVTFDGLLERSDALVLCAALTDGSRRVIGRDALARIRPGLILVNVARGGLIDETALAAALRDGRIGYAALDVRDPEPPDPATDPLKDLPNVLQTPHVAGASQESAGDLHRIAAEATLDMLEAAGRLAPKRESTSRMGA
jgi:D-3-phosphoglycerate dehydrogenase / 2-oxoglutarate reductase